MDGAQRWSQVTGCASSDIPFDDDAQPILAGGLLYTGAVGLDPATGAVRWRLPSTVAQDTISAIADGMVYVYNYDTITAIRQASAVVAWTTELTGPIASRPIINGGALYIGDTNGCCQALAPPDLAHLPDMYALDAYTGAVKWRSPTGPIDGATPVLAYGLLYVGADTLEALNPATGAIRWRSRGAFGVQSALLLAHGIAYYVSDGIYAVDMITGAARWHDALGADQSHSFVGPATAGGDLYLVRTDGSGGSVLFALDSISGEIQWQRAGYNQLTAPTL